MIVKEVILVEVIFCFTEEDIDLYRELEGIV